jgi:membrane protease YdiL (CAAX protease family)
VKALIRKLPPAAEFFLVVFLFVGVTIISRARMLIKGFGHPPNPTPFHISNSGVVWQAVCELLLLGVILWIGRIRGWSLKTFGLRPSWKWTAAGVLLFFATGLTARFIGAILKLLFPALLPSVVQTHVVSELSLPFIVLISAINPVFEESLWGGYFVHSLRRYGMWTAVLASAFLRTFCHAQLGIRTFVSILPMGVLYGLVYWRWRQLWPLVVAHSLQMVFTLLGQLYVTPAADSRTRYEVSWCVIGLAAVLVCALMAWRNREDKDHESALA